MGKTSLAISNIGSSTHRKPLSLKPQQASSKKVFQRVGVQAEANKENGNINVQYTARNPTPSKKSSVLTDVVVKEESAERLAIRKRIEEAVAAHLAIRAREEGNDGHVSESQFEKHCSSIEQNEKGDETAVKIGEIRAPYVQSAPHTPAGSNIILRGLSFLVVIFVAVWACLRLTVLEPVTVIHKYEQPSVLFTPIAPSAIFAPDTTLAAEIPPIPTDTFAEIVAFECVIGSPGAEINFNSEETVETATVIDLDLPSPTDSVLIDALTAPPATSSTSIVKAPMKMSSGHAVTSIRKFAEFFRPVKEFLNSLRVKANMVTDKLRRWLRLV